MTPGLTAMTPGRDAARDAAQRELSRREYDDAQPPLLLRVMGRVLRALGDLLDGATAGIGNGTLARVLLLAVLAGVVTVALLRLGPLGRQRATGAVFGDGAVRTAAQHRQAGDALAAEGRFAEAVRERLRAVVRELEARGVLDPRPGRTAGEVARDAGATVPALAGDLRRGAAVFDEVWYGGRAATAHDHTALVELDERVRTTRLVDA